MELSFESLDAEAGDSLLRLRQKRAVSWRAVAAAAAVFEGGGGGGGNRVQIDGSGNVEIDGSGNVQID